MSVNGIDTAAIVAEGWKPFDPETWPDRSFPSFAHFFSRTDGMLLQTVVDGKNRTCIVYARPAKGRTLDDVEHDLITAFGVAPVHKYPAGSRHKSMWAIDGILYLLSSDKLEADAINVTIGLESIESAPKGSQ